MKGLFYSTVKSNRGFFIAALISFICLTVLGSVILAGVKQSGDDSLGFGDFSVFLFPVVPALILCEFFARDLERNIKSGFLNYTLSAITRKSFVLSQLLINVIFIALGFVVGLVMLGIFRAVGGEALVNAMCLRRLVMLILFGSFTEWMGIPITLKMKSAEKAGLTLGLILGFGVALPAMCIYNAVVETPAFDDIFSVSALLIEAGATLAIYAAVYAICVKILKKGV